MGLFVAVAYCVLGLALGLPDVSLDCSMRHLMLEYARSIQPGLSGPSLYRVFDALELRKCPGAPPAADKKPHRFPPPSPASAVYVDSRSGQCLQELGSKPDTTAFFASYKKTWLYCLLTVLLMMGTLLPLQGVSIASMRPLGGNLPRMQSNLTITNYCNGSSACDEVWISGGMPLGPPDPPDWQPESNAKGNIWVTKVSPEAGAAGVKFQNLHWLDDLEVDTVLTLARYPNRRPEDGTSDLASLLDVAQTDAVWQKTLPKQPPAQTFIELQPEQSVPASVSRGNNHFSTGVGGECSRFDPPAGFLCSNATEGGGYRWDIAGPFFPGALQLNNATVKFPNSDHWLTSAASQAILTTWTNGWYTSHIPIHSIETLEEGGKRLVFDQRWSPQEWLVVVAGNYAGQDPRTSPPAAPVSNVSFQGIGFRDAASTGDWGLQRSAAVFLEGSDGMRFKQCKFKYLGGIGLMLSGYNRDALVTDSEFSYLGGSAMAAWGYTNSQDVADPVCEPYLVYMTGMVEKQSACWFQAVTGGTTLARNIFFNGPRALINFNDGFHVHLIGSPLEVPPVPGQLTMGQLIPGIESLMLQCK
eukprot:gene6628-1183_t